MVRSKIFTIVAITAIASSITMFGCDTAPPASPQAVQDEELASPQWLTLPGGPQGSLGTHVVRPPAVVQLVRELWEARRATAKYRDVNQALADGYVDINVVVPGQGIHYLKGELIDANFDHRRPEVLLYAPFPDENHLQLTSVEYLVPLALSETAPEGFTGDLDEWHKNEEIGLWTLHAWIWLPNPNGVFAEFNPLVP